MPKIAFLGAGSVIFARTLLTDILLFPELADSDIRLVDIDPARLRTGELVSAKVAKTIGARPRILCTDDRRRALDGADYVFNMVQIGGFEPTRLDFEIQKKYGLRQTIADTIGIGGVMRHLRTAPFLMDVCREMEELCPHAMLVNYTNPMAMNMMAILQASKIRSVGLCHSVQGTSKRLANNIGIPIEEINYLCAGINHMSFFLRFERNGEDLYPLIRRVVAEGRVPDDNRVRYELLMRVGYFVTESSEHHAEYWPHFIRRDRPELIERFNIPLDEYIRRCTTRIAGWEKRRVELEDPALELTAERSEEYGALIVHSMETNTPRRINANVLNHGLITNLPERCAVEVPCLVDGSGVQPTVVGDLPPQLAAIMRNHINVQELAVKAGQTGNRDYVRQAAMFDPHTAAELTLDEIWPMADELIDANRQWIHPAFFSCP